MGLARTTRAMFAVSLALGIGLLAPPGATAAITEFPLTAQRSPSAITLGPDGALWYTASTADFSTGVIGRITTGGTVTGFTVPSTIVPPADITRGPDGALWFTASFPPRIGRITTAGAITMFGVASPGRLNGITTGPDGALWFTADGQIGRITTTGAVTLFSLGGGDAQIDITAGPDGALWFTEQSANRIGRITTSGTVTHFPVPTPGSLPENITVGPDGALWFTEFSANKVGRITTTGAFTEFPIRTPGSGPAGITTGPDGALWFVEALAQKVGRMTTSGSVTDFRLPGPVRDITAGPDGALWFTGPGDAIGRITTDHPAEDAVDGTLFTEAPCDPPQIGCTKPRYVFRVSSGPAGQDPRGRVLFEIGERQGTTTVAGRVTCVRVDGSRAAVGVEFPADPNGVLAARAAVIVVEDNGTVTVDRFVVQDLPAGSAPSACPSPAGVALGPAFGGIARSDDPGVVVADVPSAPPAPTSKDQCKNGGWAALGFKNQGQCIAFVNRGPKPPQR